MIVEERMVAYINSLDIGNPPLLEKIEAQAREDKVPVIRREMQSLLRTVIAIKQPRSILEVGTAVGFSALFFCEYAGEAHVTTVERYAKWAAKARENFRLAGRAEQITLLEGDAAEILPGLSGPYDFIFMDASKGQYLSFMPQVLRLLSDGGVLVSDNVLQEGSILDSRFAVERRDRTIHSRMREYLYRLTHDPRLVTSILPVGDGAAVSVRTGGGG